MNRPKIVLYVCASVDGRITFGPNTTMFDVYKLPELYQMLMNEEEWNSFSKAVFALHKPDMFLEGSNMLVAECEKLKELPKYDGGIDGLYEDFLPADIVNRPGRKTWTAVVDGRGRFRNGYTADTDDDRMELCRLLAGFTE